MSNTADDTQSGGIPEPLTHEQQVFMLRAALRAVLHSHECIIEDGERNTPEGQLARVALAATAMLGDSLAASRAERDAERRQREAVEAERDAAKANQLQREVDHGAHLENGVCGRGKPTDIYPDWVYEARDAIRRQNENPPHYLPELLAILGWQGGTYHQALKAVARLVAADKGETSASHAALTQQVAVLREALTLIEAAAEADSLISYIAQDALGTTSRTDATPPEDDR